MPKSPAVRASCASLLLIVAAAAGAATKPAKPAAPARVPGLDQVQSTTLANGMKVIVWTDRDIPNIALYNWVRVGSRNEVPGHHRPRAFLRAHDVQRHREARAGRIRPAHGSAGRLQQRVHQRQRHGVPGLDSAHRARPRVRPRIRSPREPVVRSRRSSRASAAWCIPSGACASKTATTGFLAEQVQATAFVAHPYQIPTIGWPADIQGWKIEDLQKFFKTNYAPNNCTLILVGDVSRRRRLRAREEIPRADSAAGAAAAGAHRRARAARRETRVRRARCADAAALRTPTSRPRPTTRRARPSIC